MIENQPIYIRDDEGYAWYFDEGRIRCFGDDGVLANGYECDSLEEGIWILNEADYITSLNLENN